MDFSNVIKQKTNDELLEIHRSYYNYQKEFVIQVEHELKKRNVEFVSIDYEELKRQEPEKREQRKREKRTCAKTSLKTGILWLIGGVLVSIISFILAPEGGKYFIATGFLMYGLIRFFDGLFNLF
jgi:hypothetical protein